MITFDGRNNQDGCVRGVCSHLIVNGRRGGGGEGGGAGGGGGGGGETPV